MFTRMMIFISLLLYLIVAPIMLHFVGITFAQDEYTYESAQITEYDLSGQNSTYEIKGQSFGENKGLLSGLTFLPWYINTVFIGVPFAIWIIIGISFFIPTTNAGA